MQPRFVGDRECFSVIERQLVSLRMTVSFSTHFGVSCYSNSYGNQPYAER
jgi:hypothetical protein